MRIHSHPAAIHIGELPTTENAAALRQDCQLTSDKKPAAGFIDMTAPLANLGIDLPRGQRCHVRAGSEALDRLREAIFTLRQDQELPRDTGAERREQNTAALSLLIDLNLVDKPTRVGRFALHPASAGTQRPGVVARVREQLTRLRAQTDAMALAAGLTPLRPPTTPADEKADLLQLRLQLAAALGKVSTMRQLLADGANVNGRDAGGRSALDMAVETGQIAAACLLAAKGAKLNVTGHRGMTPLALAAQMGQTEMMEALIAAGARVDLGSIDSAPIHHAVSSGKTEAVAVLARHGANLRAPADFALFQPANGPMKPGEAKITPIELAVLTDQMEMVQALERAGVGLAEKLASGEVLLNLASAVGKPELFDLLLDASLKARRSINQRDRKGRTTAMWAIAHCRPEIVSKLLAKGASLAGEDLRKNTVLHLLVKDTTEDNDIARDTMLKMLLKHPEIRLNARNDQRQTALHLACRSESDFLVETLLRGQRIREGLRERRVLPDIEAADGEGYRALHLAAEANNLVAVHELLNHRAQIDATESNMGNTALMLAADAGHADVVEELLERGANPNRTNANHATALHGAVQSNNPLVVELLLDHGAKPDITDQIGRTPLRLAEDLLKSDALSAPRREAKVKMIEMLSQHRQAA